MQILSSPPEAVLLDAMNPSKPEMNRQTTPHQLSFFILFRHGRTMPTTPANVPVMAKANQAEPAAAVTSPSLEFVSE